MLMVAEWLKLKARKFICRAMLGSIPVTAFSLFFLKNYSNIVEFEIYFMFST